MTDSLGYLTLSDIQARIPRLAQLEAGLRKEWEQQAGRADTEPLMAKSD